MTLYLPKGTHRGLHISRNITRTGPFTGGGWKLIWHTTEGGGIAGVVKVLQDKGAEPHFVIDPRKGLVVQMVQLNEYAKALMHPAGTPETNRAHCIQIEICGFAREAPVWNEHYYRNLARLAFMIHRRVPIPKRIGRHFSETPSRLTPVGFVRAGGWFGHQHVPHNDHWDPGAMRAKHTLRLMERI